MPIFGLFIFFKWKPYISLFHSFGYAHWAFGFTNYLWEDEDDDEEDEEEDYDEEDDDDLDIFGNSDDDDFGDDDYDDDDEEDFDESKFDNKSHLVKLTPIWRSPKGARHTSGRTSGKSGKRFR